MSAVHREQDVWLDFETIATAFILDSKCYATCPANSPEGTIMKLFGHSFLFCDNSGLYDTWYCMAWCCAYYLLQTNNEGDHLRIWVPRLLRILENVCGQLFCGNKQWSCSWPSIMRETFDATFVHRKELREHEIPPGICYVFWRFCFVCQMEICENYSYAVLTWQRFICNVASSWSSECVNWRVSLVVRFDISQLEEIIPELIWLGFLRLP